MKLINNVQALLSATIAQSTKQIALNREAKQLLEMDWSNKFEAQRLDTFAGTRKNGDTNKQLFAGAAKFDEAYALPLPAPTYATIAYSTLMYLLGTDTDEICWNCRQTSPETWAQLTHELVARAEHERMASIQLRALIDSILQDTSRDMRAQADAVESALNKRLAELEDARAKLHDNLKKARASALPLESISVL